MHACQLSLPLPDLQHTAMRNIYRDTVGEGRGGSLPECGALCMSKGTVAASEGISYLDIGGVIACGSHFLCMHLDNEPGPLLGMHHLLEVCVTIELLVGCSVCMLDDDVVVLIGAGTVVGWVAMQLTLVKRPFPRSIPNLSQRHLGNIWELGGHGAQFLF